MNTYDTALEQQADLLVEEALHELGATLLDELDEYATQCDYAGCYPWLEDVICAHPHEHPTHPTLFDDAADQDPDFYC
ncbi:MAG: hypothetical protein Q8J70_02685 [Thiobacillus sp.]|nr:hypothetical protein [Thiobacillus sp.]